MTDKFVRDVWRLAQPVRDKRSEYPSWLPRELSVFMARYNMREETIYTRHEHRGRAEAWVLLHEYGHQLQHRDGSLTLAYLFDPLPFEKDAWIRAERVARRRFGVYLSDDPIGQAVRYVSIETHAERMTLRDPKIFESDDFPLTRKGNLKRSWRF